MWIIIKLSLLTVLLTSVLATDISERDAIAYLQKFGYIFTNAYNSSATSSLMNTNQILSDGLKEFQSRHKLRVTGTLSNETIDLMKSPRCGVADYQIRSQWDKPSTGSLELTWNFNRGSQDDIRIAQMAFSAWEKVSNIRFSQRWSSVDANIVISYGAHSHNMVTEQKQCENDFDDVILAHTFFPEANVKQIEIHLSFDHTWSKRDTNSPSDSSISLYGVLLHEIGHALGIDHSLNQEAIMYSYYRRIVQDSFHLDQDDINAVQEIYGNKPTVTPAPPPPPTTTTKRTPSSTTLRPPAPPPTSSPPDLCMLNKLKHFLVIEDILYALSDEYIWAINLKTNIYEAPVLLRNWFPFLPHNFSIQSVHLESNGDIIAIVNNLLYVIDSQNLQLRQSFPKPLTNIIPANARLNTMFSSYTGKTYVIFDDVHIREVYYRHALNYFAQGKTSRLTVTFPGIPLGIETSFRYINGLLYFFKGTTVFEYNQFTKSLVRTLPVSLDIFKINCPTKALLTNLKEVLSNLSSILDRSIKTNCIL